MRTPSLRRPYTYTIMKVREWLRKGILTKGAMQSMQLLPNSSIQKKLAEAEAPKKELCSSSVLYLTKCYNNTLKEG